MIRVKGRMLESSVSFVSCTLSLAYDDYAGTVSWEEIDFDGTRVYEIAMNRVSAELVICKALEFGYVDLVPYGLVFEVSE